MHQLFVVAAALCLGASPAWAQQEPPAPPLPEDIPAEQPALAPPAAAQPAGTPDERLLSSDEPEAPADISAQVRISLLYTDAATSGVYDDISHVLYPSLGASLQLYDLTIALDTTFVLLLIDGINSLEFPSRGGDGLKLMSFLSGGYHARSYPLASTDLEYRFVKTDRMELRAATRLAVDYILFRYTFAGEAGETSARQNEASYLTASAMAGARASWRGEALRLDAGLLWGAGWNEGAGSQPRGMCDVALRMSLSEAVALLVHGNIAVQRQSAARAGWPGESEATPPTFETLTWTTWQLGLGLERSF